MYTIYYLVVLCTHGYSSKLIERPEDLCEKLSELAETESRTVSNMAKVLIQEGVKNYELRAGSASKELETKQNKTQNFINALEKQKTQRLKGIPKRLKFKRN